MQAGIALDVTPTPLPVDVPAWIRLSGLDAGQEVTLRAEFQDGSANLWHSEAVFIADADGVVDLTRQAPSNGSYDHVDPMGLVWSASPAASQAGVLFFMTSLTPGPVRITASVTDRIVATVDVPRTLQRSDIESRAIDAPGVVGWLYRPSGSRRRPAVVVVGGSDGGLSPFIEHEAALFATHGYAALALAYFGYAELPPTLSEIPLEYFGNAIRWLQDQPGIDADRLAVVGYSRGGELALLLGATFPEIKAVVSYVGSGIVVSSLDGASSAWSLRGEPVPYWTYADAASLDAATITVERINGPVLLISGQRDLLWSSFALSELAMDRLAEREHAFAYEHLAYRDAGHAIASPYLPTTPETLALFGGTAAGSAAASADSWLHVLKMLADRLKP